LTDFPSPWGFAGASLVIALSPGASWMYVISTAASQGFAAGRAAILGNATGIIGHTVLATLGLATLVAVSPTLYNIIRWLGGIYLIYLAAEVFRSPVFSPSALKQTQIVPLQRVYFRGVLMNLLNPKVALLMMALLPQFILRDFPVHTQTIVFGVLHALIASTILSFIAFLTSHAANVLYDSPRLQRGFQWFSAAILFFFGTRTALNF